MLTLRLLVTERPNRAQERSRGIGQSHTVVASTARVVGLGAYQTRLPDGSPLRRLGLAAGLSVTGEGTKWHTHPGISEAMLGLSH